MTRLSIRTQVVDVDHARGELAQQSPRLSMVSTPGLWCAAGLELLRNMVSPKSRLGLGCTTPDSRAAESAAPNDRWEGGIGWRLFLGSRH